LDAITKELTHNPEFQHFVEQQARTAWQAIVTFLHVKFNLLYRGNSDEDSQSLKQRVCYQKRRRNPSPPNQSEEKVYGDDDDEPTIPPPARKPQ
jgi:hypothetical protein